MRGNQPTYRDISLRPETRAKFERIAAVMRWTLAETADALADEFLARHRIPKEAKR